MFESGLSAQRSIFDHTYLGRYRGTRILRQTPGIQTFLGADATNRGEVVIKMVRASAVPPGAKARLEYAAAALISSTTDGPADPLQLGSEGDALCLVRPFVPGTTL